MQEACAYGSLEVVIMLINKHGQQLLDMNMIMQTTLKRTKRGLLPNLSNNALSQYRQLEIMQILLNKFDISLFDITSAFEIARESGNRSVVDYLLKRKIDILDSFSILKTAFRKRDFTLVALLLENLPDIDINKLFIDTVKDGTLSNYEPILKHVQLNDLDIETAFQIACRNKKDEVFDFILQKLPLTADIARLEIADLYKRNQFRRIKSIATCTKFSETDFQSELLSIFYKSCSDGRKNALSMLFHCIPTNLIDASLAFTVSSKQGSETIKNMLLKKFTLDLFLLNDKSIAFVLGLLLDNKTRLQFDLKYLFKHVCVNGFTATVNIMLQKVEYAHLDIEDAYESACERGLELDIFKMLLEAFDFNTSNIKSALNKSCQNKTYAVVQEILLSFDHNKLDIETAMMEACSCENVFLINLFIEEVDDTISILTHVLNTKYRLGEMQAVSFLLTSLNHNVFDIDKALKRAIVIPNIDSLETFLKELDVDEINVDSLTDELVKENVDLNVVECILRILDKNCMIVHSLIKKALKHGSYKAMKCLFEKYFKDTSLPVWIIIKACANGNIWVVQWLSRQYFQFSKHLYIWSIFESSARGHFSLTSWLLRKYSSPLSIETVVYKTINYHLCKTVIYYETEKESLKNMIFTNRMRQWMSTLFPRLHTINLSPAEECIKHFLETSSKIKDVKDIDIG